MPRTNVLTEKYTLRDGQALHKYSDTHIFRQYFSQLEIHLCSTQTNTPTGSQGESYVNRYHPHIHPKLRTQDSQDYHHMNS